MENFATISNTTTARSLKREGLQMFHSGYPIGKNYFGDNGIQNYVDFQPVFKYFTTPLASDEFSTCNSEKFQKKTLNHLIHQIVLGWLALI